MRTGAPPQVAVVSPLYGTLQTAAFMLSTFPALRALPRPVVDSMAREKFDRHVWDMWSPREDVEHALPDVDFARVLYNPDAEYEGG